MKAAGGHSPSLPPSPYSLAADNVRESLATLRSSLREDQHALKDRCLDRDGNRCVVTGSCDRDRTTPGPGKSRARTQCAHILPFALRSFDEKLGQEVSQPRPLQIIVLELTNGLFVSLEREGGVDLVGAVPILSPNRQQDRRGHDQQVRACYNFAL